MLEAKMMWCDSTGVGHATWKEAAYADAVRELLIWMTDFDGRENIAEQMAQAVYLDRDPEALAAWIRLFALSETEPDYDANGVELMPPRYDLDPSLALPRVFAHERPRRGLFRTILGGKP